MYFFPQGSDDVLGCAVKNNVVVKFSSRNSGKNNAAFDDNVRIAVKSQQETRERDTERETERERESEQKREQ